MKPFVVLDPRMSSLPRGWEVHQLRRVSRLVEDINRSGDVELLSLTIAGQLTPRADEVQPPSADYLLKYGLVQPGDLVVNPMWLSGGAIGVSSRSGAVSPEYRIYRFGRAVHPRYVHHLVRSAPFMHQYRLLVRAETTFDRRVTKEDFRDLPLPLPPLAEQRAIADFLDRETARIDALITAKRRMIELLEERWAVTVREAVLADEQSRSYAVTPLKRLWSVIDCKHRTPTYREMGYPVVSPGDVTPGDLDLSGCTRFVDQSDLDDLTADGRRPRRGDIIYSRNASIGIAAYVTDDTAFTMGQDVCLITSRAQNQRFLTYALNTIGLDQLEEAKIGSTFSRVNISQIKDLLVPAPTPAEQSRVVARLDARAIQVRHVLAAIRSQIDLLVEHRQALITAAVTGELNVEVAA